MSKKVLASLDKKLDTGTKPTSLTEDERKELHHLYSDERVKTISMACKRHSTVAEILKVMQSAAKKAQTAENDLLYTSTQLCSRWGNQNALVSFEVVGLAKRTDAQLIAAHIKRCKEVKLLQEKQNLTDQEAVLRTIGLLKKQCNL